jgi:hypothetical protein
MALDTVLRGSGTGNGAEVTAANAVKVHLESDAYTDPMLIGSVRAMGEVDGGFLTAAPLLRPLEVDADYRARVSQDCLFDEEVFNYTAQNTGKHNFAATTMSATWTAGQFTTNSGSITTISTGAQLSTYAFFPCTGTTTLSLDAEIAFSGQPKTNTFIEWGIGQAGTQLIAPTDGVFFRLSSAGLQGVCSYNGTETSTGVFPLSGGTGTWTYTDNKRYQFIVYQSMVEAMFWVNDGTGAVALGRLPLPVAQPRMSMAAGGQVFFKHRIVGGAASGSLQAYVGSYNVRQGGVNFASTPSVSGSRTLGAYQGLSGGTMGGLATLPNSTAPVAAVPTNTALTANLPAGLGGRGLVTAQAAAITDLIFASYQVPIATVNAAGRRLVLRGVRVDAVNLGAAVATTSTTIEFALAYGHTAVSLATAEAATTKAPRRVSLGYMTWLIGMQIGEGPKNGIIDFDTGDAPIFVNPGEFVQLVGTFVAGTATASQAIRFTWQPLYGWE